MTPRTLFYSLLFIGHLDNILSFGFQGTFPRMNQKNFISTFSERAKFIASHNRHAYLLNSVSDPFQENDFDTTSNKIEPNLNANDLVGDRDDMKSSSLGDFDPSKKIPVKRQVLVGNPQLKVKKQEDMSINTILQELASIQKQGPRKYCILGTRHCSYLHQQIIELLSYALVLSENHVYTSGAGGTNAAAIRGALRAERPDLLTVILPQSLQKQPREIQDLLKDVTDLITMPQNDNLCLDVASRICNSRLLNESDQLIAFAFHESSTVIEATKEAKKLDMLVTMLYLD